MSDARRGVAVLPAGPYWVVARTENAWRSVSNITPTGMSSRGGLAVATGPTSMAAGFLPYEMTSLSPYARCAGGCTGWHPGELPGGLVGTQGALSLEGGSLAGGQLWALVSGRGGQLVTQTSTGSWRTATTGADLGGSGHLVLTGIGWTSPVRGWLAGRAPAGHAVEFVTDDAGKTWTPVLLPLPSLAPGTTVSASPTRVTGDVAYVAVVTAPTSGPATGWIFSSTDGGRGAWTRSASLTLGSASPVWAVAGSTVWMVAAGGGHQVLAVSTNRGAHWGLRGPVPAGLTGLALTSSTTGWAVGGMDGRARLWTSTDTGRTFTPVTLPAWVDALGAGAGGPG
ncbi:MAG: WD40/YVTN/BNR-like repeat-containing protein [Actinomycetes bacterium]